jgi:hypothetical protein
VNGSVALGVFLLLGSHDDPCLHAVRSVLAARSYDSVIIRHPFTAPACTAWHFDVTRSDTTITIAGESIFAEGVLVRDCHVSPPETPESWTQEDLLYNQAEAEAALLGWLWGLPCPVIDRMPAWLWYGTQRLVISRGPLLRRCGLPPLDSVITDCADEISQFLSRHGGAAGEQLAGTGNRYLAQEADTQRLTDTARMMPLRLTELHEGAWRGCIAGPQLVWDDGTPTEARLLDSRLRAFASAAGLSFVEFIVTSGETPRIVDVDARPRFGLFGEAAKRAIVEGLVEALT